jgi:hypothetical protein
VGVIVIVLVTVFFLGNYTTPKITTTSSTTIYQTTTETATTTFTLYPNSQPWHSFTSATSRTGSVTVTTTETVAITTTTVTNIERIGIANVITESPTIVIVNVTNMGNVNVTIVDVLLNGKSLSTVNEGASNPSLPFSLEAGISQTFTLTFSSPLPLDTYVMTIATFISSEEVLEIVRQVQGWSAAQLASYGVFKELRYLKEEEGSGWLDIYTVDPSTGKLLVLEQSLSPQIPSGIVRWRGYFWFVSVTSSVGAVSFWIDAVNATVML